MNTHHSKAIAALVLLLVLAAAQLPTHSVVAQEDGAFGDPNEVSATPNTTFIDNSATTPPSPTVVDPDPNSPRPPSITTGSNSNTFYLQNPLNSRFNTVGGLVSGFLETFSYLVVIFAVLMLIWVGLKFVLAQGNAEEIKKLKAWLLWIVVGVAIVIGARIIVRVVIDTLDASGAVSPGIIQNANNALRQNP